jgi:hypothetical protein
MSISLRPAPKTHSLTWAMAAVVRKPWRPMIVSQVRHPERRKPGRPKKDVEGTTAGVGRKRGPYRKRLPEEYKSNGGLKRKRPGEELLRKERLQLVAAVEAMQRAREKNDMLMSEAEESGSGKSVTLAYTSLVTDLLAEFHKSVLSEFDQKFGRYTVGGAAASSSSPPKKD